MDIGIVLHPACCTHQAQRVERHEGKVETDEPAPENRLAEAFVELETEGLRKPVGVSRHGAKHDAADRDIVKVRDEKQAVMEHEVSGRNRHEHASHSTNNESDDETECPVDRHGESDSPTVECKQPVENLDAGGYGDDHGHDAKETIDIRARAHGEKVVQPHHEGEDADDHGGGHHRAVAEKRFSGERCDDFGKHAKGGQYQNVYLGM